jgi:hypothetical protein
MKITTYIISTLFALSLASQGDQVEQLTISLSTPREPGHLTVNHHKGSIHVSGYHGTSVIVMASMRYGSDTEPINLGAVESNNHVVINATPRHRTMDLYIKVPHRFSLRLKNDDSGNIKVEGLTGALEISNINGDISIKDICGSAILDTVDGDITAHFKRMARGVPMAFSSVDGNIDITFPKRTNALTKARADSGSIQNDFTNKQTIKSKTNGGHPGPWSYDTLNDGGPEILIRSFLGNIHIRRQPDKGK